MLQHGGHITQNEFVTALFMAKLVNTLDCLISGGQDWAFGHPLLKKSAETAHGNDWFDVFDSVV